MRYPHLFSRLYNTPLMLHPDKAALIESVFRNYAGTIGSDALELPRPAAATYSSSRGDKPYSLSDGGVAVIPVMGTLVQRASSLDAMSGITSYSRVSGLINAALNDNDVKGIILELDSPGGEVNGLYDLADSIYAARNVKPLWAVANESAYSACYAIGSAADKLFMPRTAGVGSIGVIAMHVDQSKRDAAQGYSYTAIFSGDKKNDFNSHSPLSDSALTDLQAQIDRLYGMFVDTVARNRAISADVVKATQAGVIYPQQAVDEGFADGIATLQETIEMLEAEVQPQPVQVASFGAHRKETRMSQEANPQNASAEAQALINQARAEGIRTGATQERTRIGAIMQSEEAKGRESMAQTFALESDLDTDTAKKLLAKSPVATNAATGSTSFQQAMAAVQNPKVGASTETGQDLTPEAEAQLLAQKILGAGVIKKVN
ncbi:S49 family peptidase [Undibacterium sp. SXout11W]|uniref:S49 family peptidase n=1 Tax=Undibacterium sp. SXout11W TaxID=3413050 RepID=UPI003BF0D6D0